MGMQLKGRAFYNFLRLGKLDDPSIEAEAWQTEDYRPLPEEELYTRLKKMHIVLNEESYLSYAGNCDSPEDLAECLGHDEENDKAYLLLFELWRRLLPNKKSLSIFCDELDHLIETYDRGELAQEESLQQMLQELEDILDETADENGTPAQDFQVVAAFCAHDLEGFI